jgi:hypothetical protein
MSGATAAPAARASAVVMLLALTSAFALSQAFRTVAAIMGPPLAGHLHLTPQQLGLCRRVSLRVRRHAAGMGVSLDLWGVRRTILLAFPMAMAGALLSRRLAATPVLMLGQMLIGTGCAPAFLVCTVFISRHFAAARFTATSGW